SALNVPRDSGYKRSNSPAKNSENPKDGNFNDSVMKTKYIVEIDSAVKFEPRDVGVFLQTGVRTEYNVIMIPAPDIEVNVAYATNESDSAKRHPLSDTPSELTAERYTTDQFDALHAEVNKLLAKVEQLTEDRGNMAIALTTVEKLL